MPLKHITDVDLQKIAQGGAVEASLMEHLNSCDTCRDNLNFYRTMFKSLSDKLDSGFSHDFAYNVLAETTRISERSRKFKSALSFGIIMILSILPFVIFPESLSQFKILGESGGKIFTYITSVIKGYNLSLWTIFSVVLLFILIQVFDNTIGSNLKKKRLN